MIIKFKKGEIYEFTRNKRHFIFGRYIGINKLRWYTFYFYKNNLDWKKNEKGYLMEKVLSTLKWKCIPKKEFMIDRL